MSHRHKLRLLLVVSSAALAVAGCSSSGGQSGTLRGVTLTYWATNQAPTVQRDQQILATELAKFTKQTGIKVNLEVPTWDVLYGKILAAIASGQGPDVLNIGATWGAALQATGGFTSFDASQLAAVGGAARFVPTSLASAGAVGKSPIGVPLYSQAYGLYYNTKMFAAAGITSPPATWADFVADAKRLTKPGQWGVTVAGDYDTINSHFAFMLGRQQGSELFTADGKPDLDNAAEVAAMKRYVDLMAVDKVVNPSDAENVGSDASTKFAQGKAAMIMTQSGAQAYFAALKFTDYAVAPVPTLSPTPADGAPVESIVAGTNITVLKSSKHQQAALELVKFMTSDSEEKILNAQYGTLPPVKSLYSSAPFDTAADKLFGNVLTAHAEPMPRVPAEGTMETAIGAAVSSLWAKAATGTVTDAAVAAALKTAQQKIIASS